MWSGAVIEREELLRGSVACKIAGGLDLKS